jgi:hypothetical protein
MCRNFTYEVVGQRRRLKQLKKNVAQKINDILFFDIVFLKNFFFEFYMKPIARGQNLVTHFNYTLYIT